MQRRKKDLRALEHLVSGSPCKVGSTTNIRLAILVQKVTASSCVCKFFKKDLLDDVLSILFDFFLLPFFSQPQRLLILFDKSQSSKNSASKFSKLYNFYELFPFLVVQQSTTKMFNFKIGAEQTRSRIFFFKMNLVTFRDVQVERRKTNAITFWLIRCSSLFLLRDARTLPLTRYAI